VDAPFDRWGRQPNPLTDLGECRPGVQGEFGENLLVDAV
ncbi:MAG: hypothetical protein QOJ61_247, partial [Mycobacterium sp.]|nr:hypothetical protein [Mycobacterium sp.]